MEEKEYCLKCDSRISLEVGRTDATLAAVVGILRTLRDNPEVAEQVVRSLTDAYPREGPRAENRMLVDGFGEAVDHLLGALQRV